LRHAATLDDATTLAEKGTILMSKGNYNDALVTYDRCPQKKEKRKKKKEKEKRKKKKREKSKHRHTTLGL
jgi:hypothetical protein